MRETETSDEPQQDDPLRNAVLEMRRANVGRELLYGFVFLVTVHVFATMFLLRSEGGAWLPLGGIGTLSVWFACAGRPLAQRITRVGIALATLAFMCERSFSYLTLPQQHTPWSDSTQQILMCWMFGATVAAFGVHWFFGLRLVPPDCDSNRKPLSLRSIFLLTILAAFISLYIRGPNWQNRISYFTNGATLGLVSCAIAFGVLSTSKLTTRIAIPLAVMTIIVLSDLFVGGLTNMWRGNVFGRLSYVALFAGALGVSPALSFLLLKQLGYEIGLQRRRSSSA